MKEGEVCFGYTPAILVEDFKRTYYYESDDLKPGYTCFSPRDYPLDQKGHITTKLHSGVVAYSSYLRHSSTGILYTLKVDNTTAKEFYYSDVIGLIPPAGEHAFWGSRHFLPLVSNVFLACCGSGTFMSRLIDRDYGFNLIGSPSMDMYQMYIVAPQVQGALTYVGVGLVYEAIYEFLKL